MIAVDLDGVVAHVEPWVIRALEARLGRTPPRDPTLYRGFGISALIPEEEAPQLERALEEVLGDPEVYAQATPYPGALEALEWMYHHRLLRGYVTARPPKVLNATTDWLRAWGFPPAPLVQDGGNRTQALRLLRAEVLVEDAPEEALEAAEAGIPVLLMDRPYNRQAQHERVIRVYGWSGMWQLLRTLPLDTRARRDPLAWPEKKKEGRRG